MPETLTLGSSLTIIDALFEELEKHPLSSLTETNEYVVFEEGLIDKGDPLTSPLLSTVTVFELIPSLKITLNGAVPEKTGNEISELSPNIKDYYQLSQYQYLEFHLQLHQQF